MKPVKVIILGVDHSPQLVSEAYQPAVFRAFFEKVQPNGICIERSPQEWLRNDFYEFTYEQQYLTVPYARENHIPLFPIDWLPASEDSLLAFGLSNLEKPPFVRKPSGFQGFTSFPNPKTSKLDLFYAEAKTYREAQEIFAHTPNKQRGADFPRRLFLYRTFMQAQRITHAAQSLVEGKLLVVVGSMHKHDIEQILLDHNSINVSQPSSFGYPSAQEINEAVKHEDLLAIASLY